MLKNHNIKALYTKNSQVILEELDKEKIDLIVLAGYLAIVKEDLISKYENKIINIHPSLIPSFCGPGYYGHHVHEAVYKRGVKLSGATVHFVSSVVDGAGVDITASYPILEKTLNGVIYSISCNKVAQAYNKSTVVKFNINLIFFCAIIIKCT